MWSDPVYSDEISVLVVEKLSAGGTVIITVTGTSMEPLLRDRRDSVTVIKPQLPLKKYDLPLYRREDGAFVLHRAIYIGNGYCVCRGDNVRSNRERVDYSHVVGVAVMYGKDGKQRDMHCLSQRLYCLLYVKTYGMRKILYRIKRKIWLLVKKNNI